MKYTRYDYKKKGSDKFIFLVIFLCVILAAIVIGSGISKVFMKNISNGTNTENKNSEQNASQVYQMVVIQSGIFANKDNAEKWRSKLAEIVTPFVMEQDGKMKIYAGIFKVDKADEVSAKLNAGALENYKFIYEIKTEDSSNISTYNIMEGHIEILNRLSEKDVNSVLLTDFKKWVQEIIIKDEGSEGAKFLAEYKNYINNLPDELTKDKVQQEYTYVYNLLIKIADKK